MDLISKLLCRAVQTAFYLAIPFLPYRDPRILTDVGQIPDVLRETGVKGVLLVTDGFLRSSGITAPLETALKEQGIACTVYDRTRANPTVKNVEEARQMYQENGCQALIAFGGGSSMDCAKAVGARVVYPRRSLGKLKGILRVWRRLPPLLAVPTTAGTGSETTVAAVITDDETHHKYTINSFPLIPHYAVLDPKMTYTLPPTLTATTGMDALTHAIEAYIGRSTTRDTRSKALEATRLIVENIQRAYACGTDTEARANMLRAAYLAGAAFSKSYVGYVHAVAHSLGGQYNIPHGLANSVLLPLVLEDYGQAVHKKLHQMATFVGIATKEEPHEVGARKMIDCIKELNQCMGIPKTLSGLREEDIPMMARHAAKEANPLYPVPVLMTARELERFYNQVRNKENEE